MEEVMKVNMNMIKSMGLEYIYGQMEDSMKENGLMENKTVLGDIL